MMNHKLLTIPMTAALLPAGTAAAQNPAGKVNIVHIMSDDHSYQTISAYGGPISKLAPTPNIDRLAAGAPFSHAPTSKIRSPRPAAPRC